MGISLSTKGKGVTPHLNVTPLVDVVLVLLIIFMVVLPLLTKQMWTHLPKQEKSESSTESKALVLRVGAEGKLSLNDTELSQEELSRRLPKLLAVRPDKVVFLDAAKGAPYGTAVRAMDLAKASGAREVAVLTENLAP